MAKEVYYFSHDTSARNDEKVIALRMKLGAEGYGIYFMLLERLTENSGYISSTNYEIISFDLHVPPECIREVVEDFGLFAFDKDRSQFWSKSLCERMNTVEKMREQKRKAGLKSAESRRKKNRKATDVEQPSDDCCNTNQQRKEEKETDKETNKRLSDESEAGKTRESTPGPMNSEYERFQQWLQENAPNCASTKNFPKQISPAQLDKLKENYTAMQISEMLERIENRRDLRKRYTSLYLTLLNWLKKENTHG